MNPTDPQQIAVQEVLEYESSHIDMEKEASPSVLAQTQRGFDKLMTDTQSTQAVNSNQNIGQQQATLAAAATSQRCNAGLRQIRRPVVFCQMSGHVSINKYCGQVSHVVPCYQKIMDDVNEMRNKLQKAIYLPSEETKNGLGNNNVIVLQEVTEEEIKKKIEQSQNLVDQKFGTHNLGIARQSTSDVVKIRESSTIEGFDTIAVEKQPKTSAYFNIDDDIATQPHAHSNRQGANLKENFDFIKVPKKDIVASDSPRSRGKEFLQVKHDQGVKCVVEPPMTEQWQNIKWIRYLSKTYPTLPFGIDNIFINVNAQDLGSVIAYALTSNIYLEGLATLDYMELSGILARQ